MTRHLYIFNREALLPGLGISRMTPAPISKAIVLRTQGIWPLITGTGISHDAKLITTGHRWYVGDALMGKVAQLTPLEEWEDMMRTQGVRAIVWRPIGVSNEQMAAAAWYWQTNIAGQVEYDEKAIKQLAWRWFTTHFECGKLGDEDRLYCSESEQKSDIEGGGYDPYIKPNGESKLNPTPGTTRKRIVSRKHKTIMTLPEAFTEYGQQYMIRLPA